jgi:septum site-determining protein MinD
MLSAEDVKDILAIHMLGIIPESSSVLQASNAGIPVTLDKESDAGQAYLEVVARYLGEEPPQRDKKSFFTRLFGK